VSRSRAEHFVALEDLLIDFFPPAVRRRGREYFEAGSVWLLDVGRSDVSAEVQGSESYDVTVAWDPAHVPGECTCRAYLGGGACKHMWAVVLAADEERVGPSLEVLAAPVAPPEPAPASWRRRLGDLERIERTLRRDPWRAVQAARGERELRYLLDADGSRGQGAPVVAVLAHVLGKDGAGCTPAFVDVRSASLADLPTALDRVVFASLRGAVQGEPPVDRYRYPRASLPLTLDGPLGARLLRLLCRTGRLDWASGSERGRGLRWDPGEPWTLRLQVASAGRERVLDAHLTRDSERMELGEPLVLFASGMLVTRERVARFDPLDGWPWVAELRRRGPIRVPEGEGADFEQALARHPSLAWHDPRRLAENPPATPIPHLFVEAPEGRGSSAGQRLACRVTFDYGLAERVDPEDPARVLPPDVAAPGRLVRRDLEAEGRALARFLDCGARRTQCNAQEGLHGTIAARRLPELARKLFDEGWTIEAEGALWRRPGGVSASVRSGQDWFDLEGGVRFGDEVVPFPELLAALRQRRNRVRLGDGSVGVLPERWLERWGLLELAQSAGDGLLRFPRQQGWLLDALLAERGEVRADRTFERYRGGLARFRGVPPGREPPGFRGELRPYQRQTLGWFEFLRELGLGGCLADDMGLGKTVQVLALLEARRTLAGERRPSLVVAPRSLVFNWLDEARRFTPGLSVVDYTGADRAERLAEHPGADLYVTTYGTLRRDAPELAARRFDYLVLDEAQAIKNASSVAAKAARLLRADHRLALSGTPVENHLGELWSLLEFLNPGMLGKSRAFQGLAARGGNDLAAIARALRPFFLRRTKEEVLDDLPEKTEQTILCELEGSERRRYQELRDHYRVALLSRADDEGGLERMRIQVLEALLRLRQCACHPGLLDERLAGSESAKLAALVPRLEEIAAEGHKALVFSQFTKLLAIVRERLDGLGIAHEYLDGRTRDRKARVERFQSDRSCPLFLVSLKAGGHGLNLTAADYVFLLDPWWNPAVEAQAIDRAHRIGREKPVFAYRLIAKDTVEDKVLALQERKRELAETLLGHGTGVLRDMTREDLEALLA